MGFKPSAQINLADFRQLEACLNRRAAEYPLKNESEAASDINLKGAKLKLGQYAAITRLFGHKPLVTAPRHLEANMQIEAVNPKV